MKNSLLKILPLISLISFAALPAKAQTPAPTVNHSDAIAALQTLRAELVYGQRVQVMNAAVLPEAAFVF